MLRTYVLRPLQAEIGSRVSYELNGPVQPSVVYEFQVRCACCTGLMSDWSVSHRIKSSESCESSLVMCQTCVYYVALF